MPQKKLFALVASSKNRCFHDLKATLKKQSVEVYSSDRCQEVARLLDQTHPELVFTAKLLSDGTWRNVIYLSEKASVPTSVIVVGENKDTRFYLSAMDYGAFDFILPPFEEDAIAHVVRVASESVRRRREFQAVKAVA